MGSSTQKNTSSGTTTGTTYGQSGSSSQGTNYSSSNPNVPEWAQAAPQNFMQQVGAFGQQLQQNPNMLATPANGLLQGAYNAAANLPNGSNQLGMSNGLAWQAANATAPTYTAPTISPVTNVANVSVGGANLGPAAQAALAQAEAVKAGPAASLLDNFSAYANPVTDELVTKNLAALDAKQGQNTAAAQAALARSGAFGGSRAGIAQGQLAAQQAMDQGLLSANLRSNAFQQQAALAEADAGRKQQTTLFDAGNAQQTNLTNAGFANQNNQFNTGQKNDFTKTQAGLDQQANLAQAQIAAAAAQANAQAANQQSLAQAQLNAQGGMYNANAQQQQLDRMLSAGGLLSSNAGAASGIANNNLASQLAVGNNQMGIDRNNALAQLQGLQGLQGLLNPSTYSPFIGQTNVGSQTGQQTGFENSNQYGTMTGTETSKQKQGLLGSLLQAGTAVGSAYFMSERRVKRDIELLGREPDGLGVYRYNYTFDSADEPVRTGVMVDEVERLRPWALGPVVDGIQTVDYARLESV